MWLSPHRENLHRSGIGPLNRGTDWKRRERDCFVINAYISLHEAEDVPYDTVRGAFTEGEPVYPGAGFSSEAHIQIAVRNRRSILGIFRPNLDEEEGSWNT